MQNILIACETIRDEINYAMELTGVEYDIRWLESGLHNFPDLLRQKLLEQLDALQDCDRALMAFGSCGNSVIGLKTGDFELIIPRVDDCISMLIGSPKERIRLGENGGIYFLTPGWLRGERNLWVEYEYAIEKYGESTGELIMASMLAHYTHLGLLDTKSYNIDDTLPEVDRMAERLKLQKKIIPASVDYLCELLKGPWPEEKFITVPPSSSLEDFPLNMN